MIWEVCELINWFHPQSCGVPYSKTSHFPTNIDIHWRYDSGKSATVLLSPVSLVYQNTPRCGAKPYLESKNAHMLQNPFSYAGIQVGPPVRPPKLANQYWILSPPYISTFRGYGLSWKIIWGSTVLICCWIHTYMAVYKSGSPDWPGKLYNWIVSLSCNNMLRGCEMG